MEEGEDGRREAAIASTPSLRPNFKPNSKRNQAQLAKFQELHRRRLQLKAKPKTKRKSRVDGTGKSQGKDLIAKECPYEDVGKAAEGLSVSIAPGKNVRDNSGQQDNPPKEVAPKKRQKLHWGLDTKERWERKSNM